MKSNALLALEAEIDSLANVAASLSRDAARSSSGLGPDRIEQLGMVTSRLGPIIRRLYGNDSQFEHGLKRIVGDQYFKTMHSNCFEHVSELAGIIRGIQMDLKSG